MSFKEFRFGKMPTHWESKRIVDYTEIVTDYVANGSFASLKENVTYFEDPNYAVLIRLADYNQGFDGQFVYIDERAYNFLSKTQLFGGEIIISNVGANVGTVFKAPYLRKKMNLGPNSIMVKTKGNDDFYYYWFSSPNGQESIKSILSGSAQPKFNKTSFRNLELPIPPLSEQKAIAHILSTLDDKIENNNAIIQNLEVQAQAIFKSWFIDFGPFQDGEFVDSELGGIPEGWKVKSIKELCNRRNGFTYKSSELADESETNMLNLKSFNRNGGINFESEKPIILNDRVKEFHYLYKGDILIACTDLTQNADVIGRSISYIKNYKFNQEIFSMDLVKIEPKKEIWRTYLFYYLSSSLFKRYAESVATGTTVLHFPKDAIDDFQLLLPSSDIIKSFSNVVKGVIDIKENFIYQNVKLAQLRDILLPKLMSGEIRVGEDNLEELETEI